MGHLGEKKAYQIYKLLFARSLARESDETILQFASTNDWVVFSQDDDFLRICSSGVTVHKGLVYSHKRNSVSRIIAGLMLIHGILDPVEMADHIELTIHPSCKDPHPPTTAVQDLISFKK